MEVKVEEVQAVANPAHGNRIQINPVKARMPKEVATSKEAAHFYKKRHTTVEKAERPTQIGEIGELMAMDSKNAFHQLRPDKLVHPASHMCVGWYNFVLTRTKSSGQH
ncbi:unnamed protein product [Albugo candida]|uniref:Uncharacterized protein n=1 Tax=Albugo candida TaxID=65357 RepID=A0A024FXG2_9STRA|nr:unnamed protein product [Albugo candida]|eukprot:CCI11716.1 unnamed protein product [Albugo candida]